MIINGFFKKVPTASGRKDFNTLNEDVGIANNDTFWLIAPSVVDMATDACSTMLDKTIVS